MERARILVIGSLNMDLVVHTPRVPEDGETLIGTSFHRYFGGKGANQAVAVARQGSETIMAGRIGDDTFGQDQLVSLKKEGIEIEHILVDPTHASGVASIIIDSKGNNRIIVVSGANNAVTTADIQALAPLIAQCDCVVLQLEIPVEVVLTAIHSASVLGVKVILNPAPACALPTEIYKHITIITPNETEAQLLTGIEVKDQASARKAAKILLSKGVKAAVITRGSQGVYGLSADGEFHLAAHKVQVVDTVAAGDTFTGVLASFIGEGKDLKEAARYANAAAAIAVSRHGAQASIPKRLEIVQFLEQQ